MSIVILQFNKEQEIMSPELLRTGLSQKK
jgi:hypothetical protein